LALTTDVRGRTNLHNNLPATGRHLQYQPQSPRCRAQPPAKSEGRRRWGLSARSSDRTRCGTCSARRPAHYARPSADRMP